VIHFSKRLPENMAMNDLARLLEAMRCEGSGLLDLTESNPTRAGISYPPGVIEALSDPRALRYEPEAFGLPAARKAVAAAYGTRTERVAMTASTSEAYSWLFKLLCDPGDEVLIPRPSYPLFDHLAALESVQVRQYGLFFDHGWFIDFHTIERALNKRTRAIVLVNPNNPTGHFIRRHECSELFALASRHGIAVISDEVFREYEIAAAVDSVRTLDGAKEGLVFTLNGLSKTAGLPQMKLAWVAVSGSERLVNDAMTRLEIIADAYLSAGTPIQCALAKLLELRQPIQDEIRARLRQNLTLLASSKLRFYPVEGGWTAVLSGMPDAIDLLRGRNVLVQPGYFYDFQKPGHAVISLLTAPEVFSAGLSQIMY
jgi:aspartate/methionine/tyrosine aminotransferase